jgi:hypothetical protein
MSDYTPILKLKLPDFDQTPWDEDVNNNFSIMDAAYGKFIQIDGLTGVWQNATLYGVGQVVIDSANSSLWSCLVAHTSATAPTTFAQERAGNPSYWLSTGTVVVYLPITGGTLTGPLAISGPVGSGSRYIIGQTSGIARWVIILGTGTAESGTNHGSDFELHRHDDAGNYLSNPITISRNDGIVHLDPTIITGSVKIASTIDAATIVLDSNSTKFIQSLTNDRWEFIHSSGVMHLVRGSDNAVLFSIDSNGNVIAKGTITPSGTPA